MKTLVKIICVLIVTGCGFKIVNISDFGKYDIVSIETDGEKKINYIVKNHLLKLSSKDASDKISFIVKTEKNKSIKEKNIKNEVTKYDIFVVAYVEITDINNNEKHNLSISENGTYNVAKQNSVTRNNEKQLILLLSNSLADKILSQVNIRLNDI